MRSRTSERGESLIELLVSIVILGIGVTALLTGMGAAAVTSGYHTNQAQQVETIRNYVDAVQSAPYVSCATSYEPSGYDAPPLKPAGYTMSAKVEKYASGSGFSASCPTPDQGAQQVLVTIVPPDSRVRTEQFTILKRKPCTVLPC